MRKKDERYLTICFRNQKIDIVQNDFLLRMKWAVTCALSPRETFGKPKPSPHSSYSQLHATTKVQIEYIGGCSIISCLEVTYVTIEMERGYPRRVKSSFYFYYGQQWVTQFFSS
jgi:hypothetical protein